MLELKNVNKVYKTKKHSVVALKNVSCKFDKSGLYIITGKSGSGKSTLLYSIAKYNNIDSGQICFNNQDILSDDNYMSQIGFIFQAHNLLYDLDVFDNAVFGLEKSDDLISKANQIFERLDIDYIKYKNINELSGGELQRVAIARCLIRNASIILVDEPTASLDEINTKNVMDLLKDISKSKLVIMITHDSNLVRDYADYHIEMNKGEASITPFSEQVSEKDQESARNPDLNLRFENSIRNNLVIKNLLNRKVSVVIISIVLSILIGFLLVVMTLHNYQEYDEVYRISKLEDIYNGKYDVAWNAGYTDAILASKYDSVTKGQLLEDKLNKLGISYQRLYKTLLNNNYVNYLVNEEFTSFNIDGDIPKLEKEVLLTDYLYNRLFQSMEFAPGKTIALFDETYKVVGIVRTESDINMKSYEYYQKEYLSNIYGISVPKVITNSQRSVSPFRLSLPAYYTNDMYFPLTTGRNIENSNEIIVSENYMEMLNLTLNLKYDVIDTYDNKYNGYYGESLNPYLFLGEKVTIVGTHSGDINMFVVSDLVFENIENYYNEYLSYTQIRLSNLLDIKDFRKIYESNLQLLGPMFSEGRLFVNFATSFDFAYIPLEVIFSTIIILLSLNLIKSLVFKKTMDIAIMRSLSIRKKGVFSLYYFQVLLIFIVILIISSLFYIGANKFFNSFIILDIIKDFQFVLFRFDLFIITLVLLLILLTGFIILYILPIFKRSIMNIIKDNK